MQIDSLVKSYLDAGCHIKIGQVAVILSTGQPEQETPLLEGAILNIDFGLHTISERVLQAVGDGRLALNGHSTMRSGWEPIIEPWKFNIDARYETRRQVSTILPIRLRYCLKCFKKRLVNLNSGLFPERHKASAVEFHCFVLSGELQITLVHEI